jgi:hypothetical protein
VLFAVAERVKPDDFVAIDLAEEIVPATNAEAEPRGLGAPARVMDAGRLEFEYQRVRIPGRSGGSLLGKLPMRVEPKVN